MAVTSTPVTVAHRDTGFLNAGISASATTITVSPIYKTVSGVRTKQGLDSLSGFAEITQGNLFELISFDSVSVNATTKISTLTGVRRGLSVNATTQSLAAGTGKVWAKNASFSVVDSANYIQATAFLDKANTFSALQTISAGLTLSGTTAVLKLNELTTTQRDALTPAEGMLIKNSTTGTLQQYVGGAWASIGTDATPNGSTTVAGKFEEATVAEQGTATATGATGARLVPAVANLVKTSAGAADENKIPILDSSGQLGVTMLPATIFGDGIDGAATISVNSSLSRDMYYTDLTVDTGITLTTAGYRIFVSGTLTLTGTAAISSVGGAGGTGSNGSAGTGGAGGAAGAATGAGYFAASSAGKAGGAGGNTNNAGAAGTAGASVTNAIYPAATGGAGGAGGATGDAGGTGGAGGTATVSTAIRLAAQAVIFQGASGALNGNGGAGSGGGGAGGNTGAGGGGGGSGGNGGIILVAAKTITGAGNIVATGGAGGAGGQFQAASNGSSGGGGAGGSGGFVYLVYRTKTGWTGAITVTGGAAGAGGVGGTNNGVAGAAGTAGSSLQIQA